MYGRDGGDGGCMGGVEEVERVYGRGWRVYGRGGGGGGECMGGMEGWRGGGVEGVWEG